MMVLIVVASGFVLLVGYRTYGPLLARLLKLDDTTVTPAVEMRDDVDYSPLSPGPLMSQHFSAIAAAGPIVGPILAGAMFGWLPALIWILVGSIFIGGVHDLTALVASIRHRARSIPDVVREHMSNRSYILFLAFVWLALVYIIVAFTDVTARSFVVSQTLENGDVVTGGGIATSSLMYLVLPIMMGLIVRFTKMSMGLATVIFLPLVGVSIWAGQYIPFDVTEIVRDFAPGMAGESAQDLAVKIWAGALLIYCCIAAVVPMWLLLQPRGQLGGYFLYAALIGGAAGLLLGGEPVRLPAFKGWSVIGPNGTTQTLFPILFITIACGACSGFHALIASGTTSKQLRTEGDAKSIGYGTMLLEGMVAIVSLCCVMMLSPGDDLLANPKPNLIYGLGIGKFVGKLGIAPALGVSFALMAFTTFVYDTLDVCTRLGRYIITELTGLRGSAGRWFGTILTGGAPALFIMQTTLNEEGHVIPVWRTFWGLFGASNQLLAALTLLGVTVWLWRTRRVMWIWLVTGVPMVWMYVMSVWALLRFIEPAFRDGAIPTDPVTWIAGLLIVLAVLVLLEGIRAILSSPSRPQLPPDGVSVPV